MAMLSGLCARRTRWHHGGRLVRPACDQVGYELIGAGMLILAGGGRGLPLDYDELERWTRVGYDL